MMKRAMTLTLTLMVTSFLLPAACHIIDGEYFTLAPSAVDTIFTDFVISVSKSRSVLHCAQKCVSQSGMMYTFTKIAVTSADNCRCHSKVMTSHSAYATPSVGTRVYVSKVSSDWLEGSCLMDLDCPGFATCFNHMCVCPYDYYYSDSLRLCIADCPDNAMGTRFLPYYHVGLTENNIEENSYSSFDECLAACSSASSYVCRSVEWDYGATNCYLQDTDLAQSPATLIIGEVGWTYYQRSCL